MKLLKPLGPEGVASLLGISADLAALNAGRYHQWRTPFTAANAKQAVLAFDGDVYGGLDAPSLGEADLAFAQDHLRILSGLYGVLRPLDLIQAYRLEMGTRLANAKGRDLYAFWKETVTRELARELSEGGGEPVLVNLASEEYFKAVDPAGLGARVITHAGFPGMEARGVQDHQLLRQAGAGAHGAARRDEAAGGSGGAEAVQGGGVRLRPEGFGRGPVGVQAEDGLKPPAKRSRTLPPEYQGV
jgi:hypothetical protein